MIEGGTNAVGIFDVQWRSKAVEPRLNTGGVTSFDD